MLGNPYYVGVVTYVVMVVHGADDLLPRRARNGVVDPDPSRGRDRRGRASQRRRQPTHLDPLLRSAPDADAVASTGTVGDSFDGLYKTECIRTKARGVVSTTSSSARELGPLVRRPGSTAASATSHPSSSSRALPSHQPPAKLATGRTQPPLNPGAVQIDRNRLITTRSRSRPSNQHRPARHHRTNHNTRHHTPNPTHRPNPLPQHGPEHANPPPCPAPAKWSVLRRVIQPQLFD